MGARRDPELSRVDANQDAERDEFGRRRLTQSERDDLLDGALTAIWSTLDDDGRIHSVPVHFLRRGAEICVLTEMVSVKCRNSLRSGRATLCVETTVGGTDRRYVMAEGPVRVEAPATVQDLVPLNRRYGRTDDDRADDATLVGSALLVLLPERWIAWSDAD